MPSPSVPPPSDPPPTTPSPTPTPTSISLSPDPSEEVFVPLKEWKRRKLADLQRQARSMERRSLHTSPPQTPPGLNAVCWLVTPRLFGVLAFSPSSWLYAQHDSNTGKKMVVKKHKPKPVEEIDDSSLQQVYGPVDKQKLDQVKTQHNSPNDTLFQVVKAATSPIAALMAIPGVGDFVRSIKEVGNVLASTTDPNANESVRNTTPNKLQPRNISKKKPKRFPKKKPRSSTPDPTSTSHQGVKDKPFNYAAADAGARILATSKGVSGAKNIIDKSVDKYSLAPCHGDGMAASRWIDLELSEDIILEHIETANLEFYSSSPKRVGIFGASKYPPEQWKVLGVFEFSNVRKLQRFEIKDRLVTTRYLRVMYAGKQGHEYYCPISTIRAYGKSLLADFRDALETSMEQVTNTDKLGTNGNPESMHDQTDMDPLPAIDSSSGSEISEDCTASTCPLRTDQGNFQHSKQPEEVIESPQLGSAPTESIIGEETIPFEQAVAMSKDQAQPSGTPVILPSKTMCGESDLDNDEEDCEQQSQARKSATATAVKAMSDDDAKLLAALRADELSAVTGNDNIFRKVARLIRLLELNQTLTNQYIDTHLSRLAKALAKAQAETSIVHESAMGMERRMMGILIVMEARLREMKADMMKRDIVLCVLVIVVALLVGGQWVMWAAVSGVKMGGAEFGPADDVSVGNSRNRDTRQSVSSVNLCEGSPRGVQMEDFRKPPVPKKKKKNGKKCTQNTGFREGGRSVSNMDLASAAKGPKDRSRRMSWQSMDKTVEDLDNS